MSERVRAVHDMIAGKMPAETGWKPAPLQVGELLFRSSAFIRRVQVNAPDRLKAELQTGIPALSFPSPQGGQSG